MSSLEFGRQEGIWGACLIDRLFKRIWKDDEYGVADCVVARKKASYKFIFKFLLKEKRLYFIQLKSFQWCKFIKICSQSLGCVKTTWNFGTQMVWIVLLALMVSDGNDSKNPLNFLGLCD